jgi:VanZ family protein
MFFIFLVVLVCLCLVAIAGAAVRALNRIPDFVPSRPPEEESWEWHFNHAAGWAQSSCECLPHATSGGAGANVMNISMRQGQDRNRRLRFRLDAIIQRASQPDRRRPMPESRQVQRAERPICSAYTQILRGVWLMTMLLVAIGSLLPSDTAPIQALNALGINDKVMHFLAYALIAFLPAVHEGAIFTGVAAVGAAALGIALEYGQLYSPGRAFEGADMAADALGASFGVLIALPLKPWCLNALRNRTWRSALHAARPRFARHEMQPFR